MIKVYTIGPYTAPTDEQIQHNIEVAREAMVQLLAEGFAVLCPHTLTAGLEKEPRLTYEHFMSNDFEWLGLCDRALLLPGWENSNGSKLEVDFCKAQGIPMFHSIPELVAGVWEGVRV